MGRGNHTTGQIIFAGVVGMIVAGSLLAALGSHFPEPDKSFESLVLLAGFGAGAGVTGGRFASSLIIWWDTTRGARRYVQDLPRLQFKSAVNTLAPLLGGILGLAVGAF